LKSTDGVEGYTPYKLALSAVFLLVQAV